MFVDFDKVFNQDDKRQLKIPDTLVTYLNSQLPQGTKYKIDKDGNCVLSHNGEAVILGGLIFKPTDEQRKALGKKFSQQDVLDYSYNAQEPIQFTCKKDGYVTINGEEFPVDRLMYNPHHPVEIVSGAFYAYPQPMNKRIPITLSGNGYQRELTIKQIPNKSVSVNVFESDKEATLYVRFAIDNKSESIHMSLSYDISYARTVTEIIETASIYNAFMAGTGSLGEHPLDASFDGDNNSTYDETSLDFWKKVQKIEEALEVQFHPEVGEIDFDTICFIEQLYQGLINHVPIRDVNKIDTIDSQWEFTDAERVSESIGKVVFFEFEATLKMELFGVKKTLPCLLKIFHAKLAGITKKGKKHKIKLDDESDSIQRYTSILCFASEAELREYQIKDRDEMITLFHDAKRAREYI